MHSRFTVRTTQRNQLVDITREVVRIVQASQCRNGIAVVYCPHTTAAITINENADPSVQDDIRRTLERLVPYRGDYRHSEGNSDAHVKSAIIGSSRTVVVDQGTLLLGRWQGIYLCEFDGPRTREVLVRTITESEP